MPTHSSTRSVNVHAMDPEVCKSPTYPTIKSHPTLEKVPTQSDISTVAERHKAPMGDQQLVQLGARGTGRGTDNGGRGIVLQMPEVDQIDENTIRAQRPAR
jgi:hypothetical protein